MSRRARALRILTLRCEEASVLASQELDEPLGGLDRIALTGHLLVCAACRRFRAQLRAIRRSALASKAAPAGGPAPGEGLSREARRRIAEALESEGEAGPG